MKINFKISGGGLRLFINQSLSFRRWLRMSFLNLFGNKIKVKDVCTKNQKELYCVGSIYMSINDTDPSLLFGGTWVRIAGYVLGGINPSDTDTNTKTSFNQKAGTKIGSKYLQSHTHNYYSPIVQLVQPTSSGGTYGNYQKQYKIGTDSAGSGDAQNIQPTFLVHMWYRSA